jgi:hypothetical protein
LGGNDLRWPLAWGVFYVVSLKRKEYIEKVLSKRLIDPEALKNHLSLDIEGFISMLRDFIH